MARLKLGTRIVGGQVFGVVLRGKKELARTRGCSDGVEALDLAQQLLAQLRLAPVATRP